MVGHLQGVRMRCLNNNNNNNNNSTIGGGQKRQTFAWTAEAEELLRECARYVEKEGMKPFHKELLKYFKIQFEMRFDRKFTGTVAVLSSRLSRLKAEDETTAPKPEPKYIRWDEKNCQILLECGLRAQAMKDRNHTLSYVKLMFERFLEFVPEYKGGDKHLLKKFLEISAKASESNVSDVRQKIEDQMTAQDLARAEANENMPSDTSAIRAYLAEGKKISDAPLFKALCYKCGKLLFGDRHQNGRWSLVRNEGDVAPIVSIYETLPKTVPYEFGEFRSICRYCKGNPDVLQMVNLLNPEDHKMTIPKPLAAIKDRAELGDIALLGTYHEVQQRADPKGWKFEHLKGQVNLLSKHDKAYLRMIGILRDKHELVKPEKRPEGSLRRVKAALSWLNKHNPLYTKFLANCETVLGWLKSKVDPLEFGGTNEYETTKGINIREELGDERVGCFVPADPYDGDYDPTEADFDVGTVHPKEPFDPKQQFYWSTHPGIFNPELEAMAFPRDFPGGTGSYDPKSIIPHRDWCKLLILNLDPRFRRNQFLPFFMIDRYIKISLINHKRIVVGPVGKTVIDQPKAGDLQGDDKKKDPYARYGNKVPANIPGSKSYWYAARQDLYALSAHIGRHPDFFLTLTTNESWDEIQRLIHHGLDGQCDEKCKHQKEPASAHEYATECAIAFRQRWQAFKKKHIDKGSNGEFGEVEHYWGRTEFQKRGSLHIHIVIWVKPGTKKKDVVRAEVPRGGPDKKLLEELRRLVTKYQIHECREDRCHFSGNERLEDCKYGFPAPLVGETRPDPNGIRMLYKRTKEEDRRVVPYSFGTLLIFRAHVNVQEVREGSWQMYLTKYVTKPEKQAKVKWGHTVSKDASDVERYLTMRVLGAVEVNDILLEFQAKFASVEVLYLPVEIQPSTKVFKRKAHLPKDPESTDVYYDSKIEKYLERPKELREVTYPDFYRKYTYRTSVKAPEDEHPDSDIEEQPVDNTVGPWTDRKNRTVVKRRREIAIRFPFLLPYDDQQEQYCLRLLLENFPWDVETVKTILSPENKKRTYLEECVLRGIWKDIEMGQPFLEDAQNQGIDEYRLRELAGVLYQNGYLKEEFMQKLFDTLTKSSSVFKEYEMYVTGELDAERNPVMNLDLKPMEEYVSTFTEDQSRIFEDIRQMIAEKQQVLAAIVGPAGTGKSHLLKALCAMCKESDSHTIRTFCILAPTGAAAYIIKGRTIHSMFRFDTKCKSHVRRRTVEALIIKYCRVWLIDEMSMIGNQLFESMEFNMQRFAMTGESHKPFGGRTVIMFGDPAQLPPMTLPMFCGEKFRRFTIYTLKTIVRQADLVFTTHLRNIRVGNVPEPTRQFFKSRLIKDIDWNSLYDEVIANNITVIVSRRKDCDRINGEILDRLPGEEYQFEAIDTDIAGNALSELNRERLELKREKQKSLIRLKIGALIVLRRNINTPAGQVNGRLAIVETIHDKTIIVRSLDGKEHWPVMLYKQRIQDYGQEAYIRTQLPIDLGWCSTVHRVQGATLPQVIVKLDKSFFESGQGYVALSRTPTIEGLRLLEFAPDKIKLDDFYKGLLTWFDKMDKFAEDRDPNYPFPAWNRWRKLQKVQETHEDPHDPEMSDDGGSEPSGEENDDVFDDDLSGLSDMDLGPDTHQKSSQDKRHLSSTSYDEPMPSQKSSKGEDQPMEIEPIETIPQKCRRLLREMIERRVYQNDNGIRLNQYLEQHQEFIAEVLNDLRQREPLTTGEITRPALRCVYPVPEEMNADFGRYDPARDGNCWYRAISLSLYGNEQQLAVIRFAAVAMIASHYEWFTIYDHGMGDGDLRRTTLSIGTISGTEGLLDQHYPEIVSMRPTSENPNAWGYQRGVFTYAAEQAQLATALAINRPIHMYIDPYNTTATTANNNRRPVFAMLRNEHFQAIIPRFMEATAVIPTGHMGIYDQNTGLFNPPVL